MSMAVAILAAAVSVPNPFWPIGHQGQKEPISADVVVQSRLQPDPTAVAAAAVASKPEAKHTVTREIVQPIKPKTVTDTMWRDAQAAAEATYFSKATATNEDGSKTDVLGMNGNIYRAGEEVSFNYKGRRYTWCFTGLDEKKDAKLVRIEVKDLKDIEND